MSQGNEFKQMGAAALAIVALTSIVLMGLAIVNGYKDSGQVDNATADKFIAAIGVFGTFASVIVLAIVGKIIVRIFKTGMN